MASVKRQPRPAARSSWPANAARRRPPRRPRRGADRPRRATQHEARRPCRLPARAPPSQPAAASRPARSAVHLAATSSTANSPAAQPSSSRFRAITPSSRRMAPDAFATARGCRDVEHRDRPPRNSLATSSAPRSHGPSLLVAVPPSSARVHRPGSLSDGLARRSRDLALACRRRAHGGGGRAVRPAAAQLDIGRASATLSPCQTEPLSRCRRRGLEHRGSSVIASSTISSPPRSAATRSPTATARRPRCPAGARSARGGSARRAPRRAGGRRSVSRDPSAPRHRPQPVTAAEHGKARARVLLASSRPSASSAHS